MSLFVDIRPDSKKEGTIRKLWFFYFSLLVLWALACYGEIVRYCFDGTLLAREIAGHPYISDFVNTYAAGILAQQATHQPLNIYSVDVQYALQKNLVSPIIPEVPFFLQYPPYFFSLMMLLAPFKLLTAWVLWNLAGISLSIVSLVVLARQFKLSPLKSRLAITATLCSFPFWLSVELGQTSLMLLPSLTFAVCLLKQNRPLLGAMAAFASLIKIQYAPATFFAGLGAAFPRFGWGYLLSFLSLLAIAYITVGGNNIRRFPQALISGETGNHVSGVSVLSMENMRAQLSLFFGPDNSIITWIAAGLSLFSAVLVGLLWRKARQTSTIGNTSTQALLLAISFLTAQVFSLHCHMQDLILTAPAAICILAWLEQSAVKTQTPRQTQKWLFGILVAYPLLSWGAFILSPIFLLCRIKVMFLANCLLLVFLLKVLVEGVEKNKPANLNQG